ncbi:MAG TPA: hypothetical protein VHE99_01755 [Gammaproteobacteria bacterium]|nr:hypothetical protein [Gammaproteobacteria bacterium]
MPLIKPVNLDTVRIRAKLPKSLDTEIEQYTQWAGIENKEFFLIEAARFVLKADRDWKTHKDSHKVGKI